jgi:hypothetical protein
LKFSIIKRIQEGKKDNRIKIPIISSHITEPLQQSNDNNIEKEIITTTNNDGNNIKNDKLVKNSTNKSTDQKPLLLDEKQAVGQDEEICAYCKEKLVDEGKRPHWKWNMDRDTRFCAKCYSTKETEYEKYMNNCSVCNSRLKFIRYNPKPEWKLKGQLCRKCWDYQNFKFKNDKVIKKSTTKQ